MGKPLIKVQVGILLIMGGRVLKKCVLFQQISHVLSGPHFPTSTHFPPIVESAKSVK